MAMSWRANKHNFGEPFTAIFLITQFGKDESLTNFPNWFEVFPSMLKEMYENTLQRALKTS